MKYVLYCYLWVKRCVYITYVEVNILVEKLTNILSLEIGS